MPPQAPVYVCAPTLKINGTEYDCHDATFKFDPDINQIDTNASFFPSFTMGNAKASISIKTHDHNLAKAYFKGKEAVDVELVFKRSQTVPGNTPAAFTFAVGTASFKISNCRVTEGVELGGAADKKQSEFPITFMAARKAADGSDPTITVTYSGV